MILNVKASAGTGPLDSEWVKFLSGVLLPGSFLPFSMFHLSSDLEPHASPGPSECERETSR